MEIRYWRRVAKLDPVRPHSQGLIDRVAKSPFDAIVIGGTWGVTAQNATDLALSLRKVRVRLPVWQELSGEQDVAFGMDGYFVPMVLNTADITYLARSHVRAIRNYRGRIAWRYIVPTGYIVMRTDCAVAHRTRAETPRDMEDVIAYAEYGVRFCGLSMLYVEYSGALGDPAVPARLREEFPDIQIFYGGGIASNDDMERYLAASSAVVVGNALYDRAQTDLLTQR